MKAEKTIGMKDLNVEYDMLVKILDNTFGNVFVTDGKGKVIFANENVAKAFGMDREDIMGAYLQDLVESGVINSSTSLEVLDKKGIVIGISKTKVGDELVNFSRPIFDENGDISLVMTFGQEKSLMNEFVKMAIGGEEDASELYNQKQMLLELYANEQKRKVLKALVEANGNKSKASAALGISRSKMYKLLAKWEKIKG